jgi:hypothetical protein
MEPDVEEEIPNLALDDDTLSFLYRLFPSYGEGYKSVAEMLAWRKLFAQQD